MSTVDTFFTIDNMKYKSLQNWEEYYSDDSSSSHYEDDFDLYKELTNEELDKMSEKNNYVEYQCFSVVQIDLWRFLYSKASS